MRKWVLYTLNIFWWLLTLTEKVCLLSKSVIEAVMSMIRDWPESPKKEGDDADRG